MGTLGTLRMGLITNFLVFEENVYLGGLGLCLIISFVGKFV